MLRRCFRWFRSKKMQLLISLVRDGYTEIGGRLDGQGDTSYSIRFFCDLGYCAGIFAGAGAFSILYPAGT